MLYHGQNTLDPDQPRALSGLGMRNNARPSLSLTGKVKFDILNICISYLWRIFSGYWTTSEHQNQPLYYYQKY